MTLILSRKTKRRISNNEFALLLYWSLEEPNIILNIIITHIGYCQKTKHRNRALLLIKPLGIVCLCIHIFSMFQK